MFDLVSRLLLIGFRAAEEHRRLRALHEEARALLANPQADAFETTPAVSAWSPAQHFFHTAAINRGVLGWVREQCAEQARSDPGGGPNRNGYLVLLAGRIPRGRARTPSRFAPPERPERAGVKALLEESREALRALEPCLPRLGMLEGRRKHPRLGRLNPREWMRFAQVHTRHHQRIVRDIASEARP